MGCIILLKSETKNYMTNFFHKIFKYIIKFQTYKFMYCIVGFDGKSLECINFDEVRTSFNLGQFLKADFLMLQLDFNVIFLRLIQFSNAFSYILYNFGEKYTSCKKLQFLKALV